MTPRLLPVGDAAVLVDLGDLAEVLAWSAALQSRPLPGVVDVVPAARTVLVRWDATRTTAEAVRAALGRLRPAPALLTPPPDVGIVEVPVVYDGPDLGEVARLTGLGEDAVVARHCGSPWRVAFGGFAPGFGYLVGGEPALHVPRRAQPRIRVPAGSVALAGEYSAVYPRQSPGGWQLIGRTDLAVWDPGRDPPALLAPGRWVRFVALP